MPGTIVPALPEGGAHHQQHTSIAFSDLDLLNQARADVNYFEDLRNSGEPGVVQSEAFGSFNFGNRKLRDLPEELVDIIKTHAVRIALDRNFLSTLSGLAPCMGQFTRLKYLVLRHNQLEHFPTAVYDCPNLEYLDLRNNQIKDLPSDLNRLRSIKVISVKNNLIKRIPLCVAKMTTLHFLTLHKNPIEFPDKKEWRIEQDQNKYPDDKNRLTAETTLLKKILSRHAVMSPNQSSESAISSSDAPPKSSRSGRFPIRPSVSSVSLDQASTSPSQHRPATASREAGGPGGAVTPRGGGMSTNPNPSTGNGVGTPTSSAMARRPSLDPLAASGDNDRNRSISESHMSTSKMRKRMGMQVSRGGKGSAEILDLDTANSDQDSLHHNRDISTSSFLSNTMSVEGTESSASPSTPPTLEQRDREGAMTRLSSLPESKRKSQYVDPFVELSQGLVFAMNQFEGPVKIVVDAIKKSHARQRDLERAVYNAFTAKDDLNSVLRQLGIHDEDEASASSTDKPVEDIGELCERTYAAFGTLNDALSDNARLITEHNDKKDVRMLMHMTYAATIEVNIAYEKFAAAFAESEEDHTLEGTLEEGAGSRERKALKGPLRREPARQATTRPSSPSPRPTTSLRIKNPRDLVPNGDYASYFAQKPLPSPRLRNKAPSSRPASRLGEPRQPSNTAVSPAGSFVSEASTFIESDDEERMFEEVVNKLRSMTEFAAANLPSCATALRDAKHRFSLASPGGRAETYDQLMRMCDQQLNTTQELKGRLQTLRIRDPAARNDTEFWQLCTMFFKGHSDFSQAIKANWQPLSLPDLLRSRLGMIHARVKEAAQVTERSVWRDQARLPSLSTPVSATWSMGSFSPSASLYSPNSSVTTPRSGNATTGRGLTINSSISSVVSPGGTGSGYTTPLPATPISAALGPAAQATLGDGLGPVHANGLPRSPMAHGHDLSIASLSGMPGWYSYGPDGAPLSGGLAPGPIHAGAAAVPSAAASSVQQHQQQQPSMNRSASSASIRSLSQRSGPSSLARSVSQRR